MADDPWAQYLTQPSAPNSSSADPWAQFVKPPAAAPSSSDTPASFNQPSNLGQMSVFEKPSDASWSDFMRAHLAEWAKGGGQIGQAGADYARVASNTFGLGDRAMSAVNGTSLADEQAKTAAAADRLGPIAYAAQMTGFGPLGKLGMASGIAGDLAPAGSGVVRTALGQGVGSAAEGAAANYVSALGHGQSPDDAAKAGVIGAAVGAPIGLGGGALSQAFAGPGPAIPSAAEALATAKTGFAKAGNVLYDNADVRQAATNAINEINQQPARIARNGQGALGTLNKIGNDYAIGAGAQSGEDLNDFIRSLKVAKTGDDVDVAGRIGQRHMQSVLDNATPITAGGQVPGQVGAGAAAVNEANQAFGRSQDLQRLEDTPTVAALKKTQGYYQPGSPEYQALDDAIKGQQPAFNWWHVRHAAGPLLGLGLGAAEGYFNPAQGQSPMIEAGKEGLEGAALFSGLPLAARLASRPQATMNAARYAIGTGQKYIAPAGPPISDAFRTLIFGPMAARQQQ